MTYKPNRLTIGYEHAHVLNPWVFADLRQPQRRRGFVSPLVYQTTTPTIYHPNLSGVGAEEMGQPAPVVSSKDDERLEMQRVGIHLQQRSVMAAERMATIGMVSAMAGLAGLAFTLYTYRKNRRS